LTDHVSVAHTDTDNIETNSTTLGGWQPKQPQGSYPAEAFKKFMQMSDSSGYVWDFWLRDRPFDGVNLQNFLPFYKKRDSTTDVDWIVNRSDLRELRMSRGINNIITDVDVYYGTITGTHTGSNHPIVLTDSAADFMAAGVSDNDTVTNITDGSTGKVTEAQATTQIQVGDLVGGTNNEFRTNDVYSVVVKLPLSAQNDSVTPAYWTREKAVFEKEMDSTQATQYAAILADDDPRQEQSLTITAPSIRDGNGARWPLWEVIAQGGGYIRIADLYPAAALFSTTMDSKSTFFITGLDYDYTSNSLRVQLDNPDTRLDTRLRRAGILNSEMIARQ
jgi:hypothetical protein